MLLKISIIIIAFVLLLYYYYIYYYTTFCFAKHKMDLFLYICRKDSDPCLKGSKSELYWYVSIQMQLN